MIVETNDWRGLQNVIVTAEHIDRALNAMQTAVTDLSISGINLEDVMLAGAVIAHMQAFDERVQSSDLLAALAEEVLADFLIIWAMGRYGLTDPQTENIERGLRERAERFRARAEKAQATREAKRAAEIAAEVQKRLGVAA